MFAKASIHQSGAAGPVHRPGTEAPSPPPNSTPLRQTPLPPLRLVLALATLLAAGCAPTPAPAPRESWDGPAAVTPQRQEPWSFPGATSARKLVTPHYAIYTTIQSDEIVQRLGQLMEGGLTRYHQMAPTVALTRDPLACFVFENRRQWSQFTRSHTGDDAPVYLRINRGGYTAGDWYVAYFIGDLGTYSVAAHEGFHQFVARHFKCRPPPFLEEGMATTFEAVQWDGDLPRWDLSVNPTRLTGLRKTFAAKAFIPLDELCSMHAGMVVNTSPARIEAFYSQSWAFVRFCREARGGRYRAGLEKLMEACARGDAYGPADPTADGWHWDPASAEPLLVRFLGADFQTLDRDYREFTLRLANDAGRSEPEPNG